MNKEIKKNSIKHVYFLEPNYCFGGGGELYVRIIEYLIRFTKIKVSIIDFKDGILSRTCKKFFLKEDIEYIDYLSHQWNLEDHSIIFIAERLLGCIPYIGEDIKISMIFWETCIDWNVLFERKLIPNIGALLNQHHALNFLDYGNYIAGCRQLKQNFEKSYLPIFYQASDFQPYTKKTAEDEINLVWLGRLAVSDDFTFQ